MRIEIRNSEWVLLTTARDATAEEIVRYINLFKDIKDVKIEMDNEALTAYEEYHRQTLECLEAKKRQQAAVELTKQYIDEHGIELNEEEFELFVQGVALVQEELRAMSGRPT